MELIANCIELEHDLFDYIFSKFKHKVNEIGLGV